ncbi:MAG: hypothetical protein VKP57_07595 [Candidatus Sericytochromatia bacterium]|nr:hypothetical protein [Candidatus Sericytochromatia bacterium]
MPPVIRPAGTPPRPAAGRPSAARATASAQGVATPVLRAADAPKASDWPDANDVGDKLRDFGQKAIHLLRWPTGAPVKGTADRRILEDPPAANEWTKRAMDAAAAALATDTPRAETALARLPEADRNRYRAVLKALDPWAGRSLQLMLLRGDLPGAPALRGGQTTLGLLHAALGQPLVPGLDRRQFLNEVVVELEQPIRVEQREKGTCVATTAQILLMRQHPAEFVRLALGLATPAGKVLLAGGRTAAREPDWQATNDGLRTTVARLVQPAFMEVASPLGYDNTRDKALLGPLPLPGGLTSWASASLNAQLQGEPWRSRMATRWNREELVDEVKRLIRQGQGPVPASVVWESGGGHQIQIEAIADGGVTYLNPWGQREQMSESAFRTDMLAIEHPRSR